MISMTRDTWASMMGEPPRDVLGQESRAAVPGEQLEVPRDRVQGRADLVGDSAITRPESASRSA